MNRAAYERDICGRLQGAPHIPFETVAPCDWRPQVAACHDNVDAWVKAHPGSAAVRGWVVYGGMGTILMLTAHSVARDADGRLFDITPLERESLRAGMRFVEHVGSDDEFAQQLAAGISFQCVCAGGLSYEPVRYDEFHEWFPAIEDKGPGS